MKIRSPVGVGREAVLSKILVHEQCTGANCRACAALLGKDISTRNWGSTGFE